MGVPLAGMGIGGRRLGKGFSLWLAIGSDHQNPAALTCLSSAELTNCAHLFTIIGQILLIFINIFGR